MKFIPQASAEKIETDPLHALEYDFGSEGVNIARIVLSGRYPKSGRSVNKIANMYCLVLSGSGTLYVEDSPFEIEEGDACLIEAGERYYWDADITLAIASNPPWTPAQAGAVG